LASAPLPPARLLSAQASGQERAQGRQGPEQQAPWPRGPGPRGLERARRPEPRLSLLPLLLLLLPRQQLRQAPALKAAAEPQPVPAA
jgi:hypothetical protein